MASSDVLEAVENAVKTVPSWYHQLQGGIPLPPEPPDGWGRWWDHYGGYVWLLVIAAGLQLAVSILSDNPRVRNVVQ